MSIVYLTEQNFETEVINSDKPVLVDFWASWCGPCKMLAPIIDEIANEITSTKICKLNTDEVESIALRYRIMSIPTLILFKNGQPVATSVGVKTKSEILNFINS